MYAGLHSSPHVTFSSDLVMKQFMMMYVFFKQQIYLEGNRSFGAVEAYGNNGVFGCVLLGVVGDASYLSLLVEAFLPFLLCAYDSWDEGPSPGNPTLVSLLRTPSLHVEVWAGVLTSPLAFHIHIHP